jgi:hypothetical protein
MLETKSVFLARFGALMFSGVFSDQQCYTYGLVLRTNLKDEMWGREIGEIRPGQTIYPSKS